MSAFDRHRTGLHQWSYWDGMRMDPPREDGRRCLDEDEMRAIGLEPDARGLWRDTKGAQRLRKWLDSHPVRSGDAASSG